MVCIYCDSKTKTAVVNSRSSIKTRTTWRRRQCKHCHTIITTREYIDLENALRVTSPSGLRPFLRDQLFIDVYKAISHKKSALTDATELTDTIVAALLPLQTNGILTTTVIATTAHNIIARFDTAAGVSYAAHHQAS